MNTVKEAFEHRWPHLCLSEGTLSCWIEHASKHPVPPDQREAIILWAFERVPYGIQHHWNNCGNCLGTQVSRAILEFKAPPPELEEVFFREHPL